MYPYSCVTYDLNSTVWECTWSKADTEYRKVVSFFLIWSNIICNNQRSDMWLNQGEWKFSQLKGPENLQRNSSSVCTKIQQQNYRILALTLRIKAANKLLISGCIHYISHHILRYTCFLIKQLWHRGDATLEMTISAKW